MEEVIVDLGCGIQKRTKGGLALRNLRAEYFKILDDALRRAPTEEELRKALDECSFSKVIGIDIREKKLPQVDIVCKVGYEKIPLKDKSVDYALAHDFMEHVPFVDGDRKPVEFVFSDVYRLLKNGGYFEIKSPLFTYQSWHKIFVPSHRSLWGPETIRRFLGNFVLCLNKIGGDGKIHILLLKYE